MDNPINALLGILFDDYESYVEQDVIDYDDGRKHSVSEAKEIFADKCSEIINLLQEEILELQEKKELVKKMSIKKFIEKYS